MCKHIRKRRKIPASPNYTSAVPERPYTEWDDPMGDYNPYAIYEHPYKMKPECLKLYLNYLISRLHLET